METECVWIYKIKLGGVINAQPWRAQPVKRQEKLLTAPSGAAFSDENQAEQPSG